MDRMDIQKHFDIIRNVGILDVKLPQREIGVEEGLKLLWLSAHNHDYDIAKQ